jgi:hypothetical protein
MQLAITRNLRYGSRTLVQCQSKCRLRRIWPTFNLRIRAGSLDLRWWLGGTKMRVDESSEGDVALYGASQHADTMLTTHPVEWVRIIGAGKITRREEVMRFIHNGDPVNHANAQVSIHEVETLFTANASATISHGVCPNRCQGRSVAMMLDELEVGILALLIAGTRRWLS